MAQIGNKQNSFLNGDWGKHGDKELAANRRRMQSKSIVRNELSDLKSLEWHGWPEKEINILYQMGYGRDYYGFYL